MLTSCGLKSCRGSVCPGTSITAVWGSTGIVWQLSSSWTVRPWNSSMSDPRYYHHKSQCQLNTPRQHSDAEIEVHSSLTAKNSTRMVKVHMNGSVHAESYCPKKENCGITYSMRCGKTRVKGYDAGLLCLLAISIFSLHVIFLLLLLLIVCYCTASIKVHSEASQLF